MAHREKHAQVLVRPARLAGLPSPQAMISIAVDTAYVASQQGRNISEGIYMFDNQLGNGSTGEGTMELSTHTNVGNLIGWDVVPIDPNLGSTVVITGFNVSQGNVFGSSGYPRQQPPIGTQPAGSYWVGQAMNQGSQTYQIQIEVTIGQIQPVTYFINWDPFITAQ